MFFELFGSILLVYKHLIQMVELIDLNSL